MHFIKLAVFSSAGFFGSGIVVQDDDRKDSKRLWRSDSRRDNFKFNCYQQQEQQRRKIKKRANAWCVWMNCCTSTGSLE